ncbi:glutamine-hydrolyzing carbamoyl-phosphate synthase small subunit [Wolbachia endosymbiont of Pentidionis agamae]|uniref:glutamine-hydrolyzing carbamoyl-phosphate synthase small subunit n=1 Tax=Wolbachia endosymbiont of Pentidionis agamae TaxID=3110435 RepID=UPI002FD56EAA
MCKKNYDSVLILESGKCFLGKGIGKKGKSIGEVCFTTSITGYQHTITDPSFADQIITFTFPHIGNVGINHSDYERKKIFAIGIVVKELSCGSHPSSYTEINDWLEENSIVGISGIDTRALTKYLRENGPQKGMMCSAGVDLEQALKELNEHKVQEDIKITNKVSLNSFADTNNDTPKYRVVIVDFGVKASITKQLIALSCSINIIKPDKNLVENILRMSPDGIVLSNGPGDPKLISNYIFTELDGLVKLKIPIFGICLGHQLLAIALGGKTVKMNNGHRGSNHPVYNIINKKMEITSQNHGFVVDHTSLPRNVEVTHVSLFDNTVEGMAVKGLPIFSVQYHPEGGPGTHDSHYLFELFINNVKLYQSK